MSSAARKMPQFNTEGGTPANGAWIEREVINGNFVSQRIRLLNFPVTVSNTTGASFGSKKFFDFPTGRIQTFGGGSNLSFNWANQDIAAGGSGDYSIGTTATEDATLSSTDADVQASTAMLDPFVGGLGSGSGGLTAGVHDGRSTAKDLYLNIIIDDADVADGASDIVLVSGYIDINYLQNGLN